MGSKQINMDLSTYSKDQDVINFIQWIEPKLSNENSFIREYEFKKPKRNFKCNSIYSAYENYFWYGTFDENKEKLNEFSNRMNTGLQSKDDKSVQQTCLDILEWGHVDKKENIDRIKSYNEEIVKILSDIKDIDLTSCDLQDIFGIHCNSSFSKIYSTIIKNFIIYDSRVSCALCYLISLFAEENSREEIPKYLKFAYSVGDGKDKNKDRNPKKGKFKFNNLSQDNYLINNIIASWLMKLILEKTNSKFNDLPENKQLRALESALFMIGYKIN